MGNSATAQIVNIFVVYTSLFVSQTVSTLCWELLVGKEWSSSSNNNVAHLLPFKVIEFLLLYVAIFLQWKLGAQKYCKEAVPYKNILKKTSRCYH